MLFRMNSEQVGELPEAWKQAPTEMEFSNGGLMGLAGGFTH